MKIKKTLCSILLVLAVLILPAVFLENIATVYASVDIEPSVTFDEDHTSYVEQLEHYSDQNLAKCIKHLYDGLVSEKDNLKKGTETIYLRQYFGSDYSYISNENVNHIIGTGFSMFLCDYPEVFYLDVSKMSFMISPDFYICPKDGLDNYFIDGFESATEVLAAIDAVENVKNTVINSIPIGSSDYEKIKFVHDYLTENVEYSEDLYANYIHTIYGALHNGISVCDGYATSLKYILDDLEIPCLTVTGMTGMTRHMWNYVKLYGTWYAIDVTWDDPVVSGALTPDEIEDVKLANKYNYFLRGSSDPLAAGDFYHGRTIDNTNLTNCIPLKIPTLSTDNKYVDEFDFEIDVFGKVGEETDSPITFTPIAPKFNANGMDYAYSVSTDGGLTWGEWITFKDAFVAKRTNQNGIYKFRVQTKSSTPTVIAEDTNTFVVNINIPAIFYTVEILHIDGIEYSVDLSQAEEGTLVTVTLISQIPEDKIAVIKEVNFNITLDKVNDTTYTFTMPAGNANIELSLENKPTPPPEETNPDDGMSFGDRIKIFINTHRETLIYIAIALGEFLIILIASAIIRPTKH